MSTTTREGRLARRIEELYAVDPQFAAAQPDQAITAALDQPGVGLRQIIQTVMEGYADRPALGQRAVQFVTDPNTGRTTPHLLPHFDTITYRELWDRTGAVANALPVRAGDRVCVLGFTSVDYTVIDIALARLAAVSVPLQTGAAFTALQPIVTETEPAVIAASVDNLADAVELATTGHAPAQVVVFDYHPEVDEQREAVEAARARLAGSALTLETLTDMIERGETLPSAPAVPVDPAADPLALLIYTSGSTGAPKGAMTPESRVVNFWRKTTAYVTGREPSITLNFMPLSHVMGRQVLFGTLGSGGTAFFVAKSDLSTFFEDLALVRPTELTFVPRIWDMLFEQFQSDVDRQVAEGIEPAAAEEQVKIQLRETVLGGRFHRAMTASAPISDEMKAWVESLLDLHLIEGYGSTEAGMVLVDGQIRRPAVIGYKLVDVPDLGYFRTDQPHPRGELLIKTQNMFPGYYKRPETTADVFDADGFYRTGDVMAEVEPGQFVYIDRRNNVLKLSQGEFVTVSKLEPLFGDSPLIRQVYVYGNSARAYLLAVIVPTEEALARHGADGVKPLISASLQEIAKAADLQSYEIPRDFIVETTPWTLENGLLTGIRKLARPQLKKHYGERLERLYGDLADSQANELRALRQSGADAPVLETLSRAAGTLLGAAATDLRPQAHFTDLGGDSLSALSFANLLHEIFDVDVPVGVIVSPASDLAGPGRLHRVRAPGQQAADVRVRARPGRDRGACQRSDTGQVHRRRDTGRRRHPGRPQHAGADRAADGCHRLPGSLPGPGLAGANGPGRRQGDLPGAGEVGRASPGPTGRDLRQRRPELLAHYQQLAADHLEVLAGDKGEADLGLDRQTWQRLADTVDAIIDPAALVNHVLPYSQLFGPNALGTAELIKLALTTKLKPFSYTSTISVADQIERSQFTEYADVRVTSATRAISDSYANGYANSKWAGEVLLREAHDLCGLPVVVFRCDMILADTTYAGQLNVPDMFTRMMLSLAATGIAPGSFYELDAAGNRQRAHYDGLPVEFVAEAISTLGGHNLDGSDDDGFATYHVMNPTTTASRWTSSSTG